MDEPQRGGLNARENNAVFGSRWLRSPFQGWLYVMIASQGCATFALLTTLHPYGLVYSRPFGTEPARAQTRRSWAGHSAAPFAACPGVQTQYQNDTLTPSLEAAPRASSGHRCMELQIMSLFKRARSTATWLSLACLICSGAGCGREATSPTTDQATGSDALGAPTEDPIPADSLDPDERHDSTNKGPSDQPSKPETGKTADAPQVNPEADEALWEASHQGRYRDVKEALEKGARVQRAT